ncbi:MAG: glycosyl hydrolase family 28-related protein [Clostridiaceae bacterium]|nr:glycosyl hydrolase family 28-related protein [Clostridiaceae bacterium]
MTFINVKDNINVVADGVSDDTAALQFCIDRAKDGGTVYFPDGTYLVSAALIFYSNQTLKFDENARIRRSDKSVPLTRYLLASYSEKEWSGYSGTHNVVISGGIFDGNENLTEPSTLINTVHCKDVVIENCRFVNCSKWHCIELNSTENATVRNCEFNGPAYVFRDVELKNEMIQIDRALEGSYGPVYNCDGTEIDFSRDGEICHNILVDSNKFRCDGFPAFGYHDDCNHSDITISNNVFKGSASSRGRSRGYIIFLSEAHSIRIVGNRFIAPESADAPNIGIICENSDENALYCENNTFSGYFSDKLVRPETDCKE